VAGAVIEALSIMVALLCILKTQAFAERHFWE
jgi:hypothetical protein